MRRFIKHHPSPALVISVIALTMAVGGGAFALAASDNKKDAKIANKIVTKRASGLSVANAANATNATNATHAGTADTATVAGGPVAVAHITDGTVFNPPVADARNISGSNLTSPVTGVYCFHGLSFPFKGAQVTVDWNASPDTLMGAQIAVPEAGSDCPAGNQLEVLTSDSSSSLADTGFYIEFYN